MSSWSKRIIERSKDLKHRVESEQMIIHLNQLKSDDLIIEYGIDKNRKIIWSSELPLDPYLSALIDLMIDYFEVISKSANREGSLREFDFYLREQTNNSSWRLDYPFNTFLQKNLEHVQLLVDGLFDNIQTASGYVSNLIDMRVHFEQFFDPHKTNLKLVDFKNQKLVFGIKENFNDKINRLDLAKNLLKHYAMLKDNIEIVFIDLN